MKILKISMLLMIASTLFVACSKDDDEATDNINTNAKNEKMHLVKTIANDDFTVEILNNSGQLKVGYNELYLRLKNAKGEAVQTDSINWLPMMTMDMGGMKHQHSCPFSALRKVSNKKGLFNAYIVFSMAGDGSANYWSLKLDFTADGQHVQLEDTLEVTSKNSKFHKEFTSGPGEDGENYLLALVEPMEPKMGTNDLVVALFKKDKDAYPIVDDYTIKVDPRMPGMGNHSAPGNEDMRQGTDGFYHGKVGFSMSGYWKINLMLQNTADTIVKGNPVTEIVLESSLNFKLEF